LNKRKNKHIKTQTNTYHHSETALEIERKQIERAQKNPRDFGVLYEKYYLQIFRYILKRVADENVAAELTSNTFVKALQNIGKFQFRGIPIGGWIYQIARNELQLAYRSQKTSKTVTTDTHQLKDVLEEMEEEQDESQISELLEVLNFLKADELELLEMRYFEKRPFKEVSELLDISVPNAKVKMHRILKKIKNKLKTNV